VGGELEMLNSQHANVLGAIYKLLYLLECTDVISARPQSWLTNINLVKLTDRWTINPNKNSNYKYFNKNVIWCWCTLIRQKL
jgi:hypothetical protein